MEQINDLKQQIADLESRRDEDLRYRKWMSSRPTMTNSYGKYDENKSRVIERYDKMIQSIQKEIDALVATVSPKAKRRKVTSRGNEESGPKISATCGSNSDADFHSDDSSFSRSTSTTSNHESDGDSSRINENGKEVIEIDISSSSSDDDSSITSRPVDSTNVQSKLGVGNERDENAVEEDNTIAGSRRSYGDEVSSEDYSDEEGEDDETAVQDMTDCYAPEIKKSKLFMAVQGFQLQRNSNRSIEDQLSNKKAAGGPVAPFDPTFLDFDGNTFYKNKCYKLKQADVVVGIKHFTSEESCNCILICPFEDTILGRQDAQVPYNGDFAPEAYVQVYKCEKKISLSNLGVELEDLTKIPRLIYEPQTPGDWYSFGYFYDRNEMVAKDRRAVLTSLELFAGAGGSLQGYHNAGFKTIMAVENDKDAAITLKRNNKGIKVYEGCIKQFVQDFPAMACALDHINHIHFSSPCQDFSTANRGVANRSEVVGPRERADLSLLLMDLIRMTSCETAVFENVVGIWRKNNVHYLLNIAKEIMKLGYQVRCTVLYACDYGDPQKRPRFFMFIAKNNMPMPSIPPATHGNDIRLWPHVTVIDALKRITNENTLPNARGRETTIKPGQHGYIKLDPNKVAPTLRCSGVLPFHYLEDRLITVREGASLQSFPPNYIFYGSIASQYRQVGNAVPIGLATAVAQSFRNVLQHEY